MIEDAKQYLENLLKKLSEKPLTESEGVDIVIKAFQELQTEEKVGLEAKEASEEEKAKKEDQAKVEIVKLLRQLRNELHDKRLTTSSIYKYINLQLIDALNLIKPEDVAVHDVMNDAELQEFFLNILQDPDQFEALEHNVFKYLDSMNEPYAKLTTAVGVNVGTLQRQALTFFRNFFPLTTTAKVFHFKIAGALEPIIMQLATDLEGGIDDLPVYIKGIEEKKSLMSLELSSLNYSQLSEEERKTTAAERKRKENEFKLQWCKKLLEIRQDLYTNGIDFDHPLFKATNELLGEALGVKASIMNDWWCYLAVNKKIGKFLYEATTFSVIDNFPADTVAMIGSLIIDELKAYKASDFSIHEQVILTDVINYIDMVLRSRRPDEGKKQLIFDKLLCARGDMSSLLCEISKVEKQSQLDEKITHRIHAVKKLFSTFNAFLSPIVGISISTLNDIDNFAVIQELLGYCAELSEIVDSSEIRDMCQRVEVHISDCGFKFDESSKIVYGPASKFCEFVCGKINDILRLKPAKKEILGFEARSFWEKIEKFYSDYKNKKITEEDKKIINDKIIELYKKYISSVRKKRSIISKLGELINVTIGIHRYVIRYPYNEDLLQNFLGQSDYYLAFNKNRADSLRYYSSQVESEDAAIANINLMSANPKQMAAKIENQIYYMSSLKKLELPKSIFDNIDKLYDLASCEDMDQAKAKLDMCKVLVAMRKEIYGAIQSDKNSQHNKILYKGINTFIAEAIPGISLMRLNAFDRSVYEETNGTLAEILAVESYDVIKTDAEYRPSLEDLDDDFLVDISDSRSSSPKSKNAFSSEDSTHTVSPVGSGK